MKQLTNQSTGKQLPMVAALVLLTAVGGCKRSTSNSIGVALGSSGMMDGYAATGSTADTSSGAAAAAAASGASQ